MKRRNILLASLIGLPLLSLLVLLAITALPIPPSGEQEAEATDGEDSGSINDTVVIINLPVSNGTNSEMDDVYQDEEPIVPNNDNGFFGGYVSYPGEVQDYRRGGGHGSSNELVDEPVNDDQGTGGGNGGGADDDQNGGPGSGGTEGCDPQYWQNHPENWPGSLTPTTTFSSIFNVTIPGMEDLTLMQALGFSEGLARDDLIREGAAGMLNAMHEKIDYPKSKDTVTRNIVDGLDPDIVESEKYADDDDMQIRIDLLENANDLVCPLLPNY